MPTLRDVARVSGVSTSTVSRALANSSLVNAHTRSRIQEVAEELGYAPNRAARSLITGRTGNLGVLVPDLANPFFAVMAKEIQSWSQRSDHSVLFADSDEHVGNEADLISVLSQQVDGLLLCSPRSPDDVLHRACGGRPAVVINRQVEGFGSVRFDNSEGVRLALQHLADLRHRRIAWVAGPEGSQSSGERSRAIRRWARELGLEICDLEPTAPTYEGGRRMALPVLRSNSTAVLAYNDLVALGMLGRFAALDIKVPGEVSVIGIDDIAMSEMVHPPLTTISLPKEEGAQVAVEMLERVLADGRPTDVMLPSELRVRASTARAARGGPVAPPV